MSRNISNTAVKCLAIAAIVVAAIAAATTLVVTGHSDVLNKNMSGVGVLGMIVMMVIAVWV